MEATLEELRARGVTLEELRSRRLRKRRPWWAATDKAGAPSSAQRGRPRRPPCIFVSGVEDHGASLQIVRFFLADLFYDATTLIYFCSVRCVILHPMKNFIATFGMKVYHRSLAGVPHRNILLRCYISTIFFATTGICFCIFRTYFLLQLLI